MKTTRKARVYLHKDLPVAVPDGVLSVVLNANGQIVDADLTRASFAYVYMIS